MESGKIYGDMTLQEVEKFEQKTNSIVIFNSLGENALNFQISNETEILLHIDKIDDSNRAYPNEFLLQPAQIANIYNWLTNVINKNPEIYKFR